MFMRTWRQWQRSLVKAVGPNTLRGRERARRSSFRPGLEVLEGRALPSTLGDVFYIELENHNFAQPPGTPGPQLLGNPDAPFLNSLITPGSPNAAQTSYATNYYNVAYNNPALNIHPSEPNYVWQEAGVAPNLNDFPPYQNTPNNIVTAPNLSTLLQNAGILWKSYQEDIDLTPSSGSVNQPGVNALTSTVAPQAQWTVPTVAIVGTSADNSYTNPYNHSHQYDFEPKHDGQLFFTGTNGGTLYAPNFSPSNPEALHYAPLQQLQTDLTNNTVGRYNLITPDEYNDMHSYLNTDFPYNGHTYLARTGQEQVALGDNFLSIVVPQIMASQAYRNNGAIVIRVDESEGGNTTQYTLPEIIISPLAKGNAYHSNVPYTHSSDLKSMQELFGVSAPGGGFLGDANTPGTNDLGDLFRPAALGLPVQAPVAALLPGAGLWRYKASTGWQQLSAANVSLESVDAAGDVVAEIPGAGVWRFEDAIGWAQLTAVDAAQVSIANGIVAVELSGAGVWRFEDAIGWQQLSGINASRVDVDGRGNVAVELPGAGVWRYEDASGWRQLTAVDATQVSIANGIVAVELSGAGVWRFEEGTGWRQLTTVNASGLDVDDSGNVVAELPGAGVWRFQDATGWQQLTAVDAAQVSIANNIVAVELSGAGVWRWQDGTGWTNLTGVDSSALDV
jgi:hypothetical protein